MPRTSSWTPVTGSRFSSCFLAPYWKILDRPGGWASSSQGEPQLNVCGGTEFRRPRDLGDLAEIGTLIGAETWFETLL